MPFHKEPVIKMYSQSRYGAHIEIAPNPDAPDDSIRIWAPDDTSVSWFGKTYMTLDAEECRQLGEALIEYADLFKKSE